MVNVNRMEQLSLVLLHCNNDKARQDDFAYLQEKPNRESEIGTHMSSGMPLILLQSNRAFNERKQTHVIALTKAHKIRIPFLFFGNSECRTGKHHNNKVMRKMKHVYVDIPTIKRTVLRGTITTASHAVTYKTSGIAMTIEIKTTTLGLDITRDMRESHSGRPVVSR